jgi:hypothetical protein
MKHIMCLIFDLIIIFINFRFIYIYLLLRSFHRKKKCNCKTNISLISKQNMITLKLLTVSHFLEF